MEYRGIKLEESVLIFKVNGEYNPLIKKGLDRLADLAELNNHQIISTFKNSKNKILVDFNCGHKPNWVMPNSYKRGAGCPKCAGNDPEDSVLSFKALLNKNGHILLSNYVRAIDKVVVDFKCGHEPHSITPHNYKRGYGCPKCGGVKSSKKQSASAKRDFLALLKENNHILLSEYYRTLEKVLIDFNCGHKPNWITPDNYKSGYRCPYCKESKGERIIREWLEENNIEYIAEYKFKRNNMKNGYKYDFMLPLEKIIIEVHGVQHYKEVVYFQNRTLEEEKENDRKKKEYALLKGYKYIVVDYKENKPQLALLRFLVEYKKVKAS